MSRNIMLALGMLALVVSLLFVQARAQGIDASGEVRRMMQLADEREKESNGYVWVWRYSVSVWYSKDFRVGRDVRIPPKGAAQRKSLEIRICKHGQRVVISGEFPVFGTPPSLAKRMTEHLSKQFGTKEVRFASQPISGTKKILTVFDNRVGISHATPLLIPPPPGSQWGTAVPPPSSPPPLPVEIWECAAECRRERDIAGIGEQTLYTMVLSMDNPLRLYTNSWKLESTTAQAVTLSTASPPGWHDMSIRVSLERATGHLLRYDRKPSYLPIPSLSWQIHKFTDYSGVRVPCYVTRRQVSRFEDEWCHTLEEFHLKSLSRTSSCDFELPLERFVMDYRLVKDVTFENCANPEVQQGVVQYRWEGSLPSERDLRRMAYEQGKLPGTGFGFRVTWVVFVPGLLLIALAIYLYRRARQTM